MKTWLIAGLIVLAGLGIGLLAAKTSSAAPFKYHYSSTRQYSLKGEQPGMGMKFLIPSAITDASEVPTTNNYITFVQNVTRDGKIYSLLFDAASVSPPFQISSARLSQLATLGPEPAKSKDTTDATYIKNFISARVSSRYKITLGKATKFTNSSIKKNAWLVEFSGYDSKPKSNITPNRITGRVILAAGKQNFYYFMIASVSYNWQPNQKVWNQVLGSVKIDQ